MSRILDIDPFLGVVETFSYDEMTDSMTLTRTQDCTAIIERNKALQNDNSHWRNQAGNTPEGIDMRLLACIPVIVEEKWARDHGVLLSQIHDPDMRKAALRLLNSNEWRWLKASDVQA
jgi:hypothetical protein